MFRTTALLLLITCAFPKLAAANATSSSKIGISVVIKEKPKCDYHMADSKQSTFGINTNCELKTASLQQYASQSPTTENDLSRVVMTVQ